MSGREMRRDRRFIDGVAGGALTFLLELSIVIGLGLMAYLVAILVIVLV